MQSSKERLMIAILDLIREVGYKNASTKKIAERVEMNEASIFRLFGSKKELFMEAVYNESVSGEIIDIDMIMALPSLKTRIEVLLASCMKFGYKQTTIFRAVMTYSDMFTVSERSHTLLARVRQLIDVINDFFQEEFNKGNMRAFDFRMFSELIFSRILTASLEFTEKETDQKVIEPQIRKFIRLYSDFIYNNFKIEKDCDFE
jgi:AcrR family transcriptional regulator